ncbi:MAG: isochorismatase family protein [Acidobacteria bacterium]|nr:isochorismatase family protein [Acidobacteriota bacterium]
MIFFDIDTQNDFMTPEGALYVPRAGEICDNLAELLRAAEELEVTTISTRCAHEPDDPEFEIFPPHCLEGTSGADRVFTDLPALPRHEIAVEATAEPGASLRVGHHYVVRKRVFDLFSNRWLDGLRRAGAFRDKECVVFGVATDYCVRACVDGLTAAGARVRVVVDAIRGVAPESTEETLASWQAAGIRMSTTREVIDQLRNISR